MFFGAADETWTRTVAHTPLKRARLPVPPRPHIGGDKRDRTADLLNAIQALSQLSYTPILCAAVRNSFFIIAYTPMFVNTKTQKILQIFRLICKIHFRFLLTFGSPCDILYTIE